jgi:hypothetical protein
MWMGLSGLQAQRHDYNHVPLPKCNHCGAHREDVMHYMLQCRVFTNTRIRLLNNVMDLYESKNIFWDMNRTLVKKELIQCLLVGDPRLNMQENVELFRMVQHFICTSKRF